MYSQELFNRPTCRWHTHSGLTTLLPLRSPPCLENPPRQVIDVAHPPRRRRGACEMGDSCPLFGRLPCRQLLTRCSLSALEAWRVHLWTTVVQKVKKVKLLHARVCLAPPGTYLPTLFSLSSLQVSLFLQLLCSTRATEQNKPWPPHTVEPPSKRARKSHSRPWAPSPRSQRRRTSRTRLRQNRRVVVATRKRSSTSSR